jgi:hypothetical protein
MKVQRLRGPIPEKQIDQAIARDSELIWGNISNKPTTYPPMDHDHLTEVDGSPVAEPWLSQLIVSAVATKANISHTHQVSANTINNLTNGLAANTWVNIYPANILARYKVYLVKVRLECGANYPYSGCAVFQVATTSCNSANTIYTAPMMLHNGNSVNVELRASGGNQNSPAFDVRLPIAIPINSQLINEFLELF